MKPTTPESPKRPPIDRQFAKDVAKQLERRRTRRRLMLWTLFLGALAAAILYMRCGGGWGLGGAGKGAGSGGGSVAPLLTPVDAGPRRCEVRIAASGISVDGKPASVQDAVAACKPTMGAAVLVTGGAKQGDWEDLKAAFDVAGIEVARVEPKDESSGSASPPSGSDQGSASGSDQGSASPTSGSDQGSANPPTGSGSDQGSSSPPGGSASPPSGSGS